MSSSKADSRRPSSNWVALKKKLPASKITEPSDNDNPRKRRRIEHRNVSSVSNMSVRHTLVEASSAWEARSESSTSIVQESRNGESLSGLRNMISGELQYSSTQQQPGKYLALDCEMVGVGPEGKESSLARVSLVNYYGAIQLDVFVRQRERVADYRTQFSGVRPSDMVNARPFEEVQKQVADLLKDRILIGHAVHNDMKALLLSHPYQQTRDTQIYAFKHKVTRNKRAALRYLVLQELGVTIQSGEHSSVTDARATMALYRIHRKEWEKGQRPDHSAKASGSNDKNKRKHVRDRSQSLEAVESALPQQYPGGGRAGVSSGLSVVVKRNGSAVKKDDWWATLGDRPSKRQVSD